MTVPKFPLKTSLNDYFSQSNNILRSVIHAHQRSQGVWHCGIPVSGHPHQGNTTKQRSFRKTERLKFYSYGFLKREF